jgi:AcrR family transcriptional regulator
MGDGMRRTSEGVAGSTGSVPLVAGAPRDGTRERILEAALTVLRDVGHGRFSVQKVAREAGVYQGNITYYWPRRRDLVLALGVRVVEEYRRSFLARFRPADVDPSEVAMAFVRWMVEDAASEERVRLLPELWSMANADPEVAREVTRCYEDVTDALLAAIGAPRDRPCSAEVRRSLFLAGTAVQGLTAIHGHRDPGDPVLVDIGEALVALHGPAIAQALRGCAE